MPLLKLGQREHLETLRKGLLYMNPLAFFRSLEADQARGDSYQSEYRIALETGAEGSFSFEVGDLGDITSDLFPLGQADQVLEFHPEDLEAAGLIWD